MAKPQQPELARSGRTDVDPDHAPAALESQRQPTSSGSGGPVPLDNQPGHHPEEEQDKPDLEAFAAKLGTAAPAPAPTPAASGVWTFEFAFDPLFRVAAAAFGILPGTARVEVDEEELRARFGPWTIRTTRTNVAETERTGPYSRLTTMGPPHVSLADRGLTFATNAAEGLCIRFVEPVPGVLPIGFVRHPALTVTVADVEGLARALRTSP